MVAVEGWALALMQQLLPCAIVGTGLHLLKVCKAEMYSCQPGHKQSY
jgi:hypothetical protein